jgi:predicted permease
MQNILFTTNIVIPIFLIVLLGVFLKKIEMINDNFVNTASRIVFRVALPALVFIKISTTDFITAFNIKHILVIYLGTLFFFALSWIISLPTIKNPCDRAVFIQGSFRSNFAIIGFALISNMFGDHLLGKSAIILAFILPLYNILSIIILSRPSHIKRGFNIKKTIIEILINPLILASVCAFPFSFFNLPLPQILSKTGNYLSFLCLPLALLCIGGRLQFKIIKKDAIIVSFCGLIKIIILPIVLTTMAYFLKIYGEDLGILYFLFASPTAISSFVMAEAMDCNSRLAGNIVMMTTLSSIITISIGIVIIKSLGLF